MEMPELHDRIITPTAKLLMPADQGLNIVKSIESAARISHRSEDGTTEESWERFLELVLLKKGDWSVAEHVSVSVDFEVDRGITHELVRHRIFSYTQESTRFVNYDKMMPPRFIWPITDEPPYCDDPYCFGDHCAFTLRPSTGRSSAEARAAWMVAIKNAEASYVGLLKLGWKPQDARSVLPNALASKIRMTGNLRSWRWFLIARTTIESHPQMRQVTIPLLEQFKKTIPVIYDDIVPLQSQSIAFTLKH